MRKTLKQLISQFLFDDLNLACIENGVYNTNQSTAWCASLNEQGTNAHPEPLYAQAVDDDDFTDTIASAKLAKAMDLAFSKTSCSGHQRTTADGDAYYSMVSSPMPATVAHVDSIRLDFPGVLQCIAQKKKGIVAKWSWTFAENPEYGHAALVVIDIQNKMVYFWDPECKRTETVYEALDMIWGASENAFSLPGFRYNNFNRATVKDMQRLLENRQDRQLGSRLQFEFETEGICNVASTMVMHLCLKFSIFDPFKIEHALINALNIGAASNCAYRATRVFFSYCHLIREFSFPVANRSFHLQPANITAFLNPQKRTIVPGMKCFGMTKANADCSRGSCKHDNYCWQHRAALFELQQNNKKCNNPTV